MSGPGGGGMNPRRPTQGLLQALQTQAPTVQLALLSNYSAWYEQADAALGLHRYFSPDLTVVSYRTGARKPEATAFASALAAIEATSGPCSPDACVLVDDRLANCEAAQALGLRAIHFQGAADLAVALSALGLPLAAPGAAL